MDLTTKPNEFERAINAIRASLEVFRRELTALPEQEAEARRRADLDEVRRIQRRQAELHAAMLEVAAEHKRELQAFIDGFLPVAAQERQRVEGTIAETKQAREQFEREYLTRAAELDSAIARAEREQARVDSDLSLIVELQVGVQGELAAQIDESLSKAA